MAQKETAEQKLLKVIESSSGNAGTAVSSASPDPVQRVANSVKNISVDLPSLSLLNNILSLFKGKLSLGASPMALGLREVNIILLAVALGIFGLFVLNLKTGMASLKKGVEKASKLSVPKTVDVPSPAAKPVTVYLDGIRSRNIFQPFEAKVEEKKPEEAAASQAKRIELMVKDLKLVGISWLDSPQSASAMIEDVKTGITHFLKQDDVINGIAVKKIYADRVILTFEGEELTVRF